MKEWILKVAVGLLRLIYCPLRALPLKNKVTIISRQSDEASLDIRMLSDVLRERHPDLTCLVLSRFIGPGIGGKISYLPHMLRQMVHIATSRVVVLDGYCITACVLRHKPETKVIQMWHALAAIKKFGYQTIGKSAGHSRLIADAMCMHRNYDYILAPSEETGRIYKEAFQAREEQLIYLGLPRIDLICHPRTDAAEIRNHYQIPENKEVILYAPTFRKGQAVPAEDIMRAADPDRSVLVILLHPLDRETQIPAAEPGPDGQGLRVITDTEFSSYEWMGACDKMITDYSAMAVEFALTGKPLYFYIRDIESYEKSTGLNMDPGRELTAASARTAEELAAALSRPYDREALERFRNKYVTVDTENCTAKLGDFIYGTAEKIH